MPRNSGKAIVFQEILHEAYALIKTIGAKVNIQRMSVYIYESKQSTRVFLPRLV